MRVLLTHGYFINEDEKEQQIMRPYPPLGLLYISAFLDQNGIDNQVFDTTFSDKVELMQFIGEYQPDVVALYTNLMTKLNVLEIITKVRSQTNAAIILGGPDVTYNIENYLKAGADYLVIGEGELTMFELVKALQDSKALSDIEGIAFYDQSGQLCVTKERTKIKNIDELPIPNRDAIDITRYLTAWKNAHGISALNVSTQRGCPYTCKWCSTAVYGLSYRRRSPVNVIDELKEIKEKYNPDSIWFVDDVFTVSHKWLNELADAMDEHQIHIPFECISRADRMDTQVIQTLKRMGCFRVWIGAESGSQKIIDAMDRRVSVEKVREMIQETRRVGIEAGTFIMLGYPGETEADIQETIHHLKVSNPDHFTITLAYPIKGTDLYNEVSSEITTNNNWSLSTDRDIDFKRNFSKKYYRFALSKVTNEVYYHKLSKHNKLKAMIRKLRSIRAGFGMSIYKNL